VRKFGLIGFPLSHSFSQKYFTEKFEKERIQDCSYSNFSIKEIGELPAILSDPELRGLNVTIPHKRAVLDLLHRKDTVVEAIGACNCIKIENGLLLGYNTDVTGFEGSLVKKLADHHLQALVLGTGGASKAVEYVLEKRGIGYRMVTRQPREGKDDLRYEEVDATLLHAFTLVINTTPLGMYPKVEECPPLPYEALGAQHYLFDLVYNPAETMFLRKGRERGAVTENGYDMLAGQAEAAWDIWNA